MLGDRAEKAQAQSSQTHGQTGRQARGISNSGKQEGAPFTSNTHLNDSFFHHPLICAQFLSLQSFLIFVIPN